MLCRETLASNPSQAGEILLAHATHPESLGVPRSICIPAPSQSRSTTKVCCSLVQMQQREQVDGLGQRMVGVCGECSVC